MKTGILTSLSVVCLVASVNALKLNQDATEAGSDLSFLLSGDAEAAAAPTDADQGTDLTDILAASEPAAETAAEPATEATAEPAADATAEPEAEAATETATEAVAEAAAEPATQAAVEPVATAVAEAVSKVVKEVVAEPVAEAVAEAAAEPEAEAAAEPEAKAAEEPVAVTAAAAEPATQTAVAPVADAVAEAVKEVVKEVVAEPVAEAVVEAAAETPIEEAAEAVVAEPEVTAVDQGFTALAPEGEDQISNAMYDLNADELAELYAMEEDIYEDAQAMEEQMSLLADNSEQVDADDNGTSDIAAWMAEMAAIEAALLEETQAAIASEDAVKLDLDEVLAEAVAEAASEDATDDLDAEILAEEIADGEVEADEQTLDLAASKVQCKDTVNEYIEYISGLTTTLNTAKDLTDRMSDTLAQIDPNMENGAEGKAFIRKMYKVKGQKPQPFTVVGFPQCPEQCVTQVAGKIIQIEDLEEDISKAESFRDFFAHVYCAAYVNSLVTMKDGLYQIFPGGLDQPISDELQRLYGPLDQGSAELDAIEIASVEAYFEAITTGVWIIDETSLIQTGEPMQDAMALCASNITDDVELAQQDRDDYLNDVNFLNYLKSL